MQILDLILECGINPGRQIGRKREHHCSCPGCGGTDRFRVWPEDNNGTGAYNCMGGEGCGLHGDNVQFCIDFLNLDFKSAARKCGRDDLLSNDSGAGRPRRKPRTLRSPGQPAPANEFKPNEYKMPSGTWISKAHEFAVNCNSELLKFKKAMSWLADRGIDEAAVRRYCLGWNPGDGGKPLYKSRKGWGLPLVLNDQKKPKPLWIPVGLVIPYEVDGQAVRLRIRRPLAERNKNLPELKYYVVPGSFMGTMVLDPVRKAHVVVEAELDAIACAAASHDAGAVSVMTIEGKPDAYALSVLKNDLHILNALDFEIDSRGKLTKVARRANKWWQDNFPDRCIRWPVPVGKDPGEAVAKDVDLAAWIKTGLPPVFSIKSPVERAAKINEASRQSVSFHTGHGEMATVQKEEKDVPAEVLELRELLKASGVLLWKREGGRDLGIRKPVDYNFAKYHKRIDELVFLSLEVGGYINTLPDGLIGPKGLIR